VSRRGVSAVFFDVDFTLIYPGPTFQGEGYARFCERYAMAVDASRFAHASVSTLPVVASCATTGTTRRIRRIS